MSLVSYTEFFLLSDVFITASTSREGSALNSHSPFCVPDPFSLLSESVNYARVIGSRDCANGLVVLTFILPVQPRSSPCDALRESVSLTYF